MRLLSALIFFFSFCFLLAELSALADVHGFESFEERLFFLFIAAALEYDYRQGQELRFAARWFIGRV